MLLGLRTAIYHTPDIAAGTGVKDIESAHARLLELGAAPRSEIQDVGEGIRVADVLDPWGNVFGIIENPNFALSK